MAKNGRVKTKPVWRKGAESVDLAAVAEIDARKEVLAKELRELSAKRQLITNRCIQRHRWKESRKGA